LEQYFIKDKDNMEEEILNMLIPVVTVFIMAIACAILSQWGGFNMTIFLGAFGIGIAILCWIPLLPYWFYIVPMIIIALIIFRD